MVESDDNLNTFIRAIKKLFKCVADHSRSNLLGKVSQVVTNDLSDYYPRKVFPITSVGGLKAPGPNGMSILSYRRFWELVENKAQHEILEVLNGADAS